MEPALKNQKFNFFKKKKPMRYHFMNIMGALLCAFIFDFSGAFPALFKFDDIAQSKRNIEILQASQYHIYQEAGTFDIKDLQILISLEESNYSSLLLSSYTIDLIQNKNISPAVKQEAIDIYNKSYMRGLVQQENDFKKIKCNMSFICYFSLRELNKELADMQQKVAAQLEHNKKIINGEIAADDWREKTTLLLKENTFLNYRG